MANSVDSDQTPRSAASDLDLHCLLPVDVTKNGWISVKRVDLAAEHGVWPACILFSQYYLYQHFGYIDV